jgi:hypothetical protein
MRLSTRLLLFVMMVTGLAACESPVHIEFRSTTTAEQFQLSIPANFSEVKDLNPQAQIQALDEKNGFFLIGIREDKSELKAMRARYELADYAWFVERKLTEGIDTTEVTRLGETEIGGMQALRFSFKGLQTTSHGTLDMWMRACVIETPMAFYQIVSWTSADRASELDPTMALVEQSFQELWPSKQGGGAQGAGAESASI